MFVAAIGMVLLGLRLIYQANYYSQNKENESGD